MQAGDQSASGCKWFQSCTSSFFTVREYLIQNADLSSGVSGFHPREGTFLLVPNIKTRGNRQNLMQRKFHHEEALEEEFFCAVTEHWNRLSTEPVDSPSLLSLTVPEMSECNPAPCALGWLEPSSLIHSAIYLPITLKLEKQVTF